VQKTAPTLACDHEIGKARKFKNNRARAARFAALDGATPYPQLLWIRMCIAVGDRI
jgi:hypothetical protein